MGEAEGESRAVLAAVAHMEAAIGRIDQLAQTLQGERDALRAERLVHRETTETMLRFLEQMREHWSTSERVLASVSRLEGNLREGLADTHHLVDKLPGRRMH